MSVRQKSMLAGHQPQWGGGGRWGQLEASLCQLMVSVPQIGGSDKFSEVVMKKLKAKFGIATEVLYLTPFPESFQLR